MVLVLTLLIGGLTAAVLTTTFYYQRASWEALNRELAYSTSMSGARYYLSELAAEPNYFVLKPAPHNPMWMGKTSFQLESAQSLGVNNQWRVVLRGLSDQFDYRLNAVLGHRQIKIPNGVVAVGDGDNNDVVLRITTSSRVGSYDPTDGAYDPSDPGEDANIGAKGAGVVSGSTKIHGDILSTGALSKDSGSSISGNVQERAADFPVDDIDPIVYNAMNQSKSSNSNAALAAIFGTQWKPVSGSENYGDLLVTKPETYVIPSGTYRFRRFEVANGAKVVFDTALGASKLVYVGAGQGTGTLNDLTVASGSTVNVDPKGTQNGLLTVLGIDCDFVISGNSVFGQAIGDPNNAGYCQIISLGGNTSSDDIRVVSGSKVYGRLYAAAHAFTMDKSVWFGSALTRTVNFSSSTFAVDAGSFGSSLVDPTDYQVLARWPGTASGS